MTITFKAAALATVVAIGGAMAGMSPNQAEAALDICKDVQIRVINNTGAPVKVFDLDYIDTRIDRKRSENITNRVIPAGGSYFWKRNLEGVKNTVVKLRTQHKELNSKGRWKVRWVNTLSKPQRCTRGASFTINLT